MCITYIYDSGEAVNNVLLLNWCVRLAFVAGNLFGDIGKQLGEISNFENLVQREKLQSGYPGAFKDGREGTIWEGALSFCFDQCELFGVWTGETIW